MIKVAINGFGRIGRITARALLKNPNVKLMAINDLSDSATLAHLFKYDSIHGKYSGEVTSSDKSIQIDSNVVYVYGSKDPTALPWKDLGVDVVIESTGIFRSKEKASMHIAAGAKKVIISAPPKGGDIKSIVLGVNDDILDGSEDVISNASCTTNCAAPMVKILDELWGIEDGFITTIHSYTGDQRLHDAPHSDLRRARAAACSIVPTSTGAAQAIINIFPHLEGKLAGSAYRVPVPDGSLTDITCRLKKKVSINEINEAFLRISSSEYKNIMEYCTDPIVSTDIVGNPSSCIFDSLLTEVSNGLVKVVGWYDNEYGYSSRLADLVSRVY